MVTSFYGTNHLPYIKLKNRVSGENMMLLLVMMMMIMSLQMGDDRDNGDKDDPECITPPPRLDYHRDKH